MGKSQRTKGYSAEREVVNIAKEWGCNAKRSPCSIYPDVVIDGKKVSVKRRKNGMLWAYDELKKHDYILFRADHEKWLKISFW